MLSTLSSVGLLFLMSVVALGVTNALLLGGHGVREKPLIEGNYMRPDISPVEILAARGYVAKEYYFTTKDGYRINIARGRNPLFNKGKAGLAGTMPILFVHGTIISGSIFLTNSEGVRPKNFRKLVNLDTAQDANQVYAAIGKDPSCKTLPSLALNFGYEVWILNRRGFNRSTGKLGHENRTLADAIAAIPDTLLHNGFKSLFGGNQPGRANRFEQEPEPKDATPSDANEKERTVSFIKDLFQQMISLKNLPAALMNFGELKEKYIQTFDPDYWDFSLDEPIAYEFPQAIDMILKESGKPKVHVVGFSSGGPVILLAAAQQPELAEKIASAVLWAPAVNTGSQADIIYQLSSLVPMGQSYSGPIPFTFQVPQIEGLLQTICSTESVQRTLCSRVVDLLFGFSGRQTPPIPSCIAAILQPTSFHELNQLGQFSRTQRPCKLNFNSPAKNLKAYGQLEPPCYDLAKVRLKHIFILSGKYDRFVPAASVRSTMEQLGVPSEWTHIHEPGIYFNHAGFIFHDDADRLAVIPSFLRMEWSQTESNRAKSISIRKRQRPTEKPESKEDGESPSPSSSSSSEDESHPNGSLAAEWEDPLDRMLTEGHLHTRELAARSRSMELSHSATN